MNLDRHNRRRASMLTIEPPLPWPRSWRPSLVFRNAKLIKEDRSQIVFVMIVVVVVVVVVVVCQLCCLILSFANSLQRLQAFHTQTLNCNFWHSGDNDVKPLKPFIIVFFALKRYIDAILADFWKFLMTNFSWKSCLNIWWLWGYFEKHIFEVKLPWSLIGQFFKIGPLLFQHLATLVAS